MERRDSGRAQRWMLMILATGFLAGTGYAILDLDGNGSSDIWEEHYGASLPANEDPDGDGATNKQEYDRGTNPLVPDHSYETIAIANDPLEGLKSELRFFGGIARTFKVEETTDLVAVPWSEAGTVPGADATILMEETINSDKKFFRVDPQGADPDGEPAGQEDQLDGVEEHLLGSDNTSRDSDGDGMPDDYEAKYRHVLDINTPDGHLDPDGDGLTNLQEYQLGIDPGSVNIIGPVDLGFEAVSTGSQAYSFRAEHPSDLYYPQSGVGGAVVGWQPETASGDEYIELWDETIDENGDPVENFDYGSRYVELQAHWGAHGVKQQFDLLPGDRLNFILCFKGRYDCWWEAYDNAFDLVVEGAPEVLVNGEPVPEENGARRSGFMGDDEQDKYADWHYVSVSILADPEATGLVGITLSLIPETTESNGEDITYGGFVDILPVELDVNNDGDYDDPEDGLKNYLPGYIGNSGALNTGTSFLQANYQAQPIRLMIPIELNGAKFRIKSTTNHDGFCSNKSDSSLVSGNTNDFSFYADQDSQGPASPNEINATVGSGMTWTTLYCKDYGAACTIEIVNSDDEVLTEIKVPVDADDNQIADRWQIEQIQAWNTQYNASLDVKLSSWSTLDDGAGNDRDKEKIDPDKENTGLPPHKTAGDGLSVLKEYRGYITDYGPNHNGGHVRLSAAKKELLVEVSEIAGIQAAISTGENQNPNVSYSLDNLQNAVTELYGNETYGAGIDVYWASDLVDNLGGLVDYNHNGALDPGERPNAYIWTDTVEKDSYTDGITGYSVPAVGGIEGGSYVYNDRKLKILNQDDYQSLYVGPTAAPGRALHLKINRNPNLNNFVKLILLTRWGSVDVPSGTPSEDINHATAVLCQVDIVGPASSVLGQKPYDQQGVIIAVTGTAEEATRVPQGGHYSAEEFSNVIAWSVAHELGHLLVGGSHYGSVTTLMADRPGPGRDGISVTMIEEDESSQMNLKDKYSVDE